jgi:hypothetical protein
MINVKMGQKNEIDVFRPVPDGTEVREELPQGRSSPMATRTRIHKDKFFAGVYEKAGIRPNDILRVDIGLLEKRHDFLLVAVQHLRSESSRTASIVKGGHFEISHLHPVDTRVRCRPQFRGSLRGRTGDGEDKRRNANAKENSKSALECRVASSSNEC